MKPNRRSESNFHNDVATTLDLFDWRIVGTVSLPKADGRNISERRQDIVSTFESMMGALAKFAKMKREELVYFGNAEFEPDKGLHHVHFLIGHQGLGKFTAWQVCEYLQGLAQDIDYPISVEPCEVEVDPVGYVTRKVFLRNHDGRREAMPLDFSVSDGFVDLFGSPSGLRPQSK